MRASHPSQDRSPLRRSVSGFRIYYSYHAGTVVVLLCSSWLVPLEAGRLHAVLRSPVMPLLRYLPSDGNFGSCSLGRSSDSPASPGPWAGHPHALGLAGPQKPSSSCLSLYLQPKLMSSRKNAACMSEELQNLSPKGQAQRIMKENLRKPAADFAGKL